MEVLTSVLVTPERGVEGDCRGIIKPGGKGKRQVSLMERADWDAVMAELGRQVPWWERRANLLVDGLDLPQTPGQLIRVGPVLLTVTAECDPCIRMEAVAAGLEAALTPDWRGGALARVLEGGTITVGDRITIEEP
ncbi:MOSC domain-containing protein [Sphingomonas lenta]|uniref:MOSC domain-containing protein n=1 Tax=Sphingomonas lenta TaxID=1141887 RepID=A0A2A2SJU2_9SPHN|nr:MOSC domain-containing protein [Sphingomonas lenta]PAX09301.1 MOSC domain-containing protein [Sphingomonas lenta]